MTGSPKSRSFPCCQEVWPAPDVPSLQMSQHPDVQVIAGPIHRAWAREEQREMIQQLFFHPDAQASSSHLLPPHTTDTTPVMGQAHRVVQVAQPRAKMWNSWSKGRCVLKTSWALSPTAISSSAGRISHAYPVLLLSWAHPINKFCPTATEKYRTAGQWVVLMRGTLWKKKKCVGIEGRWTHLDTAGDGVESWEGEGKEAAMPSCNLSTDCPVAGHPLNFFLLPSVSLQRSRQAAQGP